jgi:hypothetical protein
LREQPRNRNYWGIRLYADVHVMTSQRGPNGGRDEINAFVYTIRGAVVHPRNFGQVYSASPMKW